MAVLAAFAKRLIALFALPASIIFVAWLFTPLIRDQFVETYAISIFIASLCRFGADQFLYKTGPQQSNQIFGSTVYSRATLLISLAFATVAYLIYLSFGALTISAGDRWLVAANIIALIFVMDRSTIFQLNGHTFLSSLAFPTVYLALAIIAMMAGLPVNYAFLTVSGVVICVYLIGGFLSERHDNEASVPLRPLLRTLSPYAALGANKAMFDWGVSVYLVALLSPTALSIFIIANRLAAMLSIPASSLNSYLLREFSVNIQAGDTSANRNLMMQSIRLCLASQIAIVAVYVIGISYIAALFKVDQSALIAVLIPLSLAQIVHGLTGPVGSMLLMSGHEKLVASISILVAVGSLVFGYLSALYFGIIGLGIAIGGMLILQNILYVIAMWRKEKYLPFAGALGLEKSRP